MKKTRLITSLITCVLCLSFLAFGVLAAVSVNFSLSTSLTFNPEGVYVEISGQVYRGEDHTSLEPMSDSAYKLDTINNFDIVDGQPAGNNSISWSNIPSVALVPQKRAVKYRIEVKNLSENGIKGMAEVAIFSNNNQLSPTSSETVGGVTTSTYTNLTVTEYQNYIKNIQPNDTQVYEIIIELAENASSVDIDMDIAFTFTDEIVYTESLETSTYEFVNLGSYPQRYVGDIFNEKLEELYQAGSENLKATGKTYIYCNEANPPSSTSSYDATPIEVVTDEYSYIDGNKYVRMTSVDISDSSSTSTPTYMTGDEAIADKPAWFKVEPIQWRVLDRTTADYAFLVSELSLAGAVPFYPVSEGYGNVADYSREDNIIRQFLLNYFYPVAFSNVEKGKIVPRTVSGAENQNVWILSIDDYSNTNYFNTPSGYLESSIDAQCSPSDFALAQGAYMSNYQSTVNRVGTITQWSSTTSYSYYGLYLDTGGAFYDNICTNENSLRPGIYYQL